MYITEGVGWIGSVLVLIPYVVPFSKTIDFILEGYTYKKIKISNKINFG